MDEGMTAQYPSIAGSITPAELISGPCALPDAPLAMPRQTLEAEAGLLRRILSAFLPRPTAPTGAKG
jgi:hypothetical protein